MGYKCSSCNVEFPSRAGIVKHMIEIHNSPYLEGDEQLKQLSKRICTELKRTDLLKLMEEE